MRVRRAARRGARCRDGEDHPLIARYEGSVLVGYQMADYNEAKRRLPARAVNNNQGALVILDVD